MNASDRGRHLWFTAGPVPDHQTGGDDADTGHDRQWWRASHGREGAGPPYWIVDQRVLEVRLIEDALRDSREFNHLLGFLPERLLTPLDEELSEGLSPGLRRLGPGRGRPVSDVAAEGAVAMILVDGTPATALEWRADHHVLVGFIWDRRLVAAIRPVDAHEGDESPGLRFVTRTSV
jgi:hypothetical protein